MVQKVMIFGFSHCGTTVLRSILGHIPDVYQVIDETKAIDAETMRRAELEHKKYALIKFPQYEDAFMSSAYDDYIKIFIVRNPLFVYSSLNSRLKNAITGYHAPEKFIHAANRFLEYQKNPVKNLYLIRYEDMFDHNYRNLRTILDAIGFVYTDKIFHNEEFENKSHSFVTHVPTQKPRETDHERYRTYQINQPFVNNNDISKLCLTKLQYKTFTESPSIRALYPDILSLHVKNII